MTKNDKPIDAERVTCEVCLKEIFKSEALSPEATDYVVYFCGLECHESWKKQRAKPGEQAKKPVS